MSYEFKGNTYARAGGGPAIQERPPAPEAAAGPAPYRSRERSLSQPLAALFGAVFLLVGVAGFVPGVTSNYDELALLGTDSRAELLGLFQVSILHNVVHMLFGVGLLAAARASWSRAYLFGGAGAYLVVVALGSLVEEDSDANFLPVNGADNLLHLALTVGLLAAGVVSLLADRRSATS